MITRPPCVSVIIPVYNAERYLRECLDSVFAQAVEGLEVICLDDGSTDGSLKTLREYAARIPSMQIVANDNHRQGFERNRGVELSRGKYIYFMDADDVLERDALARLVEKAEADGLDLLLFEGTSFYESKEIERQYPRFKTVYRRHKRYPFVYRGADIYCEMRKNGDFLVSPCLQLIRRDYLLSHGIRFPEGMVMMEDNLYSVRALIAAERVAVIPDALFRRRVRPGSTMTRSIRLQSEIVSEVKLFEELVALADKYYGEGQLRLRLLQHALAFLTTARHCGAVLTPEIKSAEKGLRSEVRRASALLQRRCLGDFFHGFWRCLIDNGVKYTIVHAFERAVGRA